MHSLIFCPVPGEVQEYNPDILIAALQQTGLIANTPLPATISRITDFHAGERFLDLIIFLGCSPAIQLKQDEQGSAYCYISFQQHKTPGKIYTGSLSRPARCGLCQAPFETDQLNDCVENQTQPVCRQCQKQLGWSDITWNKTTGMTTNAIVIHNIFPHEAVPADELVSVINSTSGLNWRYFYI